MLWEAIPREAIIFTVGVAFVLVAAGLSWATIALTERLSRRRETVRSRRSKASRY